MKRKFVPILLFVVFGLPASAAFAHAFPEHSSPGANDTLSKPPKRVRVAFDSGLEPAFSMLKVKNADGKVVSRESRVVPDNRKLLEAPLPALAPGRYHVYWRVVAHDTHPTEGDFSFTVK